jgi:hypothetical protein
MISIVVKPRPMVKPGEFYVPQPRRMQVASELPLD